MKYPNLSDLVIGKHVFTCQLWTIAEVTRSKTLLAAEDIVDTAQSISKTAVIKNFHKEYKLGKK